MSLDFSIYANRLVSVFDGNLTSNLAEMAREAGLYKCIWRPETLGITTASQMILPLEIGLETLRSDPERFKRLNPSNGWGIYDNLVSVAEKYLTACRDNPDGVIETFG